MTRVKVCLPRVAITHRGVETRKEIFVVGIAADGRHPDVKTVSQTYKGGSSLKSRKTRVA